MRDVILVRKNSKVKAKKKTVKKGHFENLYTADVGGAEINAKRGWLSVEATYRKSTKTRKNKFSFVNTHLEAFGDPKIREAQAKELFGTATRRSAEHEEEGRPRRRSQLRSAGSAQHRRRWRR